MDRQDAKPHRPSLLTGGEPHSAASPSAPRILADMENRAPGRGQAVARRSRPLLLVAGACTLVLLAGFWLFSGSADETTDVEVPMAQAALPPTPAIETTAPAPSSEAPNAAMIVGESDAPAAEAAAVSASATDNPFAVTAEPAAAAAATPAASRASTPATKVAGRPESARATANSPVATQIRKPARSGRSKDDDLLATLLKNIEQRSAAPDPAPAANAEPAPFSVLERPQTGNDHDALESLVRQVRDRDGLRAAGTGAAMSGARAARNAKSAKAGSTPAVDAERSGQIQTRLRQCPRANTRQGLQCRQNVCAKYAGRDPACPAPVTR